MLRYPSRLVTRENWGTAQTQKWKKKWAEIHRESFLLLHLSPGPNSSALLPRLAFVCYLSFSPGRCQQTDGLEVGQRERWWVDAALQLCCSVSSCLAGFLWHIRVIPGPQNRWAQGVSCSDPGFTSLEPDSQIPSWKETGSP